MAGKTNTKQKPCLLWFRRDLRLSDHPALTAAVASGAPVIPVYVLDDKTPGPWKLGGASRWWLAQSLLSLQKSLAACGSHLILKKGRADEILPELARQTEASALYFTRGYEPYQPDLERRLKDALETDGIECRRFSGQILFEPEKLLNKSGDPFRVYTPFTKAAVTKELPRTPLPPPSTISPPETWPISEKLEDWHLEPKKPDWAGGLRETWFVGEHIAQKRLTDFVAKMLKGYGDSRNIPGMEGTSRLSPHLAFGEISPLQVWSAVLTAAEETRQIGLGEVYLKEILWREFSYHLLFHFPHLPDSAFRPEFDAFRWDDNYASHLKAWQKGLTGYPIVDAGMRQLWQTGWMHNRVRMITASFLIKHLLVPWQIGEAWFWDTLVDADLASNAASWQWVAGSGADAAPYFRIFNPVLQGEKFDPNGDYVRLYCPELAKLPNSLIHKPWEANPTILAHAKIKLGSDYPLPIVDHAKARQRALAAYTSLKQK